MKDQRRRKPTAATVSFRGEVGPGQTILHEAANSACIIPRRRQLSIFNQRLAHDYVCAQCQAGLVEVYDEGWKVVCSADPTHQGKWRKSTVELRRQQEVMEGIELGMAYPELLPPKMPDSVKKDMEALFGSIEEAEERETALPVQRDRRGGSRMWK